ncbi:MAG: hypothetical protein V1749_08200 [Candidatus Desantisbacteria bacterium]
MDLQVVADFGTQTTTTTVNITVVKGMVHHIDITPTTATIEARGTASFTAKAYNQYGYELTEITDLDWQIAQGSGTINGNLSKTVLLQTNDVVGTITLTASIGMVTGTSMATIIHGSVTSISILPGTASVEVMGTKSFTTFAVNQFGHSSPVSYILISDIGGTITPTAATAVFTAGNKTGRVEIMTEAGDKRATASITIIPGQIERLIFVQPTAGSLPIGMPGTMTIQTQDEYGNISIANNMTIVCNGNDSQSRFAPSSSGATWTETGIFPLVGTSNLTLFFKQNDTNTSAIITASILWTSISATHAVTIELLGSSSSGDILADDGRTRVKIGTGALTGAGYIEIDTSGTSTANIVLAGNEKDDADQRINRIEGTLRRFEIHNATITTTAKIQIAIPYLDTNPKDGLVDGTQIKVSSLRIYWLRDTGTDVIWQPEDSWIDYANSLVCANVSHFSYYILMGLGFPPTLEKAIAYPNPYNAEKHAGIGIKFDKLTENSTIKIFNIAGELVREIHVSSPQEGWDACNSEGEKVASGIYIYLIKDPAENKKMGKLAVIK